MGSKIPGRYKYYTCIVYEDSAVKGWLNVLSELHLSVAVSPYHNQDLTATGEPKKPHWHVVFMYDSVKSRSQAMQDFDAIGGVYPHEDNFSSHDKWVQVFDRECVVGSLRSMLRYLCHLDNPDKTQYAIDDVITFSGFNYEKFISSNVDEWELLEHVCEFIEEQNVISFNYLVSFARKHRRIWLHPIVKYAFFFRELLKSNEWANRETFPERAHNCGLSGFTLDTSLDFDGGPDD